MSGALLQQQQHRPGMSSLNKIATVDVRVVKSSAHALEAKVPLGSYWNGVNGPVLICFFRRFG